MPTFPVKILDCAERRTNTLRAILSVQVGKAQKISGVMVHVRGPSRWVCLPSKPRLDSTGMAQRDDRSKIRYDPTVEWTSKEVALKFRDALLEQLDADFPSTAALEEVA